MPKAYIVDKIVDEVCMREKSSLMCLIHKITLVLKTDGFLLFTVFNKCNITKYALKLDNFILCKGFGEIA